MLITKLETMEKIVSSHSNLKWDGWNVLDLKKTNSARTDVNGIRINNQWYVKQTFIPDRNGWEIPSKYKV